jgi:predicted nucleic acid-binding Zn finger protein
VLFGGHFDKATQIVDQGGVFAFIGRESQRKVYQVQGNKKKEKYTVFPRHYCSCHSFLFEVATKGEAVYVRSVLNFMLIFLPLNRV